MAQTKFGRHYVLKILTQSGIDIVIEDPLTLEFDITRNVLTSANVCQLRIYNLNQSSRSLLRYDFDNTGSNASLTLQIGYDSNLFTVFSGNFTQAWSVREGNNFITQIECFDGGFAISGATTNRTFPAGTQRLDLLTQIMGDLTGVSFGAISPSFTQDASGRPYTSAKDDTYSGNTYNILQELTGGALFIDNGKAYILASADSFVASITQIDASTGLLGTPLRETTIVNFDMILEPSLMVGQNINLQSTTFSTRIGGADSVNGISKVVSVKHRGMISGSVCGTAITTVGLFYGTHGGVTVVPL